MLQSEDPKDIEDYFAANLRAARETVGLSQDELARQMTAKGFKWHQATVYKVETRNRTVSMAEAATVARLLRTSVTDLTRPPLTQRLRSNLHATAQVTQQAHAALTEQATTFLVYLDALGRELSAVSAIPEAEQDEQLNLAVRVAQQARQLTVEDAIAAAQANLEGLPF